MNYPHFFDIKNSLRLFGLQSYFELISNLYSRKKLPKVLMLTGKKGLGKSTLACHFLYSIFDINNYDKNSYCISQNSKILAQFKINIFPNIIYINGSSFKSTKVEDIRNLKNTLNQSPILNKDRFIIFDDIELFNQNSLNALLKTIEEPSKYNYFFFINNKTKPLLQTVKSRALEININIKESQRLDVIRNLTSFFKIDLILDPKLFQLSPGDFIKFNYICNEFNISPLKNYQENLSILLNLFKKNKEILFINMAFFITDIYFRNLIGKNSFKNHKIFEIKNYILDSLNNFLLYNLNQSSLLNDIKAKINNE